jgi:hypothetical protein
MVRGTSHTLNKVPVRAGELTRPAKAESDETMKALNGALLCRYPKKNKSRVGRYCSQLRL